MTGHPVTDDRGKLSELEIEPAVFPGRDAHRIFIEPNLRALIARIETAIDPGLRENINRRTELRVDEQTEPWIKKRVTRRPDQTGCRAAEGVALEIKRAANTRAHIGIWTGKGQRFVHAIEKILRACRRCRADKKDDCRDRTELSHGDRKEFAADPSAGRNRTSNSVHPLSEATRFNSPP